MIEYKLALLFAGFGMCFAAIAFSKTRWQWTVPLYGLGMYATGYAARWITS